VVVVAVELERLHFLLFCCGRLCFFVLWLPLLTAHSSFHEVLYWGHTMERWQSYVVSLTDYTNIWKYTGILSSVPICTYSARKTAAANNIPFHYFAGNWYALSFEYWQYCITFNISAPVTRLHGRWKNFLVRGRESFRNLWNTNFQYGDNFVYSKKAHSWRWRLKACGENVSECVRSKPTSTVSRFEVKQQIDKRTQNNQTDQHWWNCMWNEQYSQ
jgi:hypothetical protein